MSVPETQNVSSGLFSDIYNNTGRMDRVRSNGFFQFDWKVSDPAGKVAAPKNNKQDSGTVPAVGVYRRGEMPCFFMSP